MSTLGWIELVNHVVLALLLGAETGLLLGTHPALARLPHDLRAPALRPVCRRYGFVLPILAVSGLITATAATVGLGMVSRPFWLGAIAWLCLGGAVALLLKFIAPLNQQLATFPDGGAGRAGMERRWQLWHAATAVLEAVAFILFAVATLAD